MITFQEPWVISHPNVRHRAPGLVWFYGFSSEDRSYLDYDELSAEQPEKSKLISTMCSSRTGNVTLHTKRLSFSNQLKLDLPDLDIFGHGLKRVNDKAEALRPYKYHVVVENHVAPHHLTEKLPVVKANRQFKLMIMKPLLILSGVIWPTMSTKIDCPIFARPGR